MAKSIPITVVLVALSALLCATTWAESDTPTQAATDWPQWRGPNRDGIAPASPKLLDTWPKEGPPLLWKSDWIPACQEGGTGSPIVADGKVYVYASAKFSTNGGKPYQIVTPELLADAGWLANLPEDLGKKIEAAWSAKDRPSTAGWDWLNPELANKPAEMDAFLAKKPDVDTYIKNFIATLKPEETKQYGDYIKKRLLIDFPRNKWGVPNGLSWDQLTKLNAMRDTVLPSYRQWGHALEKLNLGWFVERAFLRAVTITDTVYCLDAATGKELWHKTFPVDVAVLKDPGVQWWCFGAADFGAVTTGSCSTPAFYKNKLYVAGLMGLYCLNAKDGSTVWQAKGPPEHASPLVSNGVVYNVGVAYDAETGAERWKNPFWDGKHKKYEWTARYTSPLLLASGGKNYVVTTDYREEATSSYCLLDLETGQSQWKQKSPIGVITNLHNDILIAPPMYGGSGTVAYKLTPTGAEKLWKKLVPGSAGHVYQDHLYMPSGAYHCVDLKTGEYDWKKSIGGGVAECSSSVLADGKILTPLGECHQLTKNFGDLTYSLSMIKATPEKYTELGVFNPKMCMMTAPAVANGKLYLRLLDGIVCYDLQEHGVYADNVAAAKDTVTFNFKQTGGGLSAKDIAAIQITAADGSAKPASARIDGDALIVDVKDAALPFTISAPAGALTGKNGLPSPALTWNESRALKFQKCFDNTLKLTSAQPLQQDGRWSKPEAFEVAGAKVTKVDLDAQGHSVSLITDKTWKVGDAITISYSAYPVEKGEPRREKLTATAAEPQRAAATFVKLDESTRGTWKGVYGTEGALIAGDKGVTQAPKCATVELVNKTDGIPWAPNAAEDRYAQKTGDAKDRTVTSWVAPEQFDINIDFTDGKEHQVALYCMAWGKQCELLVEVIDADTRDVLHSLPVKDFIQGKYLVWNIKGQVIVRLSSTIQAEGTVAQASGLFIDPAGKVGN